MGAAWCVQLSMEHQTRQKARSPTSAHELQLTATAHWPRAGHNYSVFCGFFCIPLDTYLVARQRRVEFPYTSAELNVQAEDGGLAAAPAPEPLAVPGPRVLGNYTSNVGGPARTSFTGAFEGFLPDSSSSSNGGGATTSASSRS